MPEPKFGALPPIGMEWVMKTTAETVAFVRDTEKQLHSLNPEARSIAERLIELAKRGDISILAEVNVIALFKP